MAGVHRRTRRQEAARSFTISARPADSRVCTRASETNRSVAQETEVAKLSVTTVLRPTHYGVSSFPRTWSCGPRAMFL